MRAYEVRYITEHVITILAESIEDAQVRAKCVPAADWDEVSSRYDIDWAKADRLIAHEEVSDRPSHVPLAKDIESALERIGNPEEFRSHVAAALYRYHKDTIKLAAHMLMNKGEEL